MEQFIFQIKYFTEQPLVKNWGACNRFQIHTNNRSLFFLKKTQINMQIKATSGLDSHQKP